jgi:DNA-binding winged helix-turn-helix (wHTH) protein/TolB-like protein/tetratricopeptide (TPR) repeat protein
METQSAPARKRFGTFEVNLSTGELLRSGVKRRIQEQPFQVLAMLLESPGEVITREALRERLWPADTFVDFEHGLNAAVRRLRLSLDDSAENPRFIETITRRGYRFIAPVTPIDFPAAPAVEVVPSITALPVTTPRVTLPPASHTGSSPTHRTSAIAAVAGIAVLLLLLGAWKFRLRDRDAPVGAGAPTAQLAVLPLQVLTGADADRYLGVGVADAILTRLANVRSIRVRPTSAILSFVGPNVDAAAAGRGLQVDHVLNGTIQRLESGYRFNLQLVRTSDGASEWGHQIDVARQNLSDVEDRVSSEVASALQVRLTSTERAQIARRYTDNAAAYEQYLEGRALLGNYSESNVRQAMDHFQQALTIDPSYVLAEAGLAIAAGTFSVRSAYEKDALPWGKQAEEHARRALQQDPGLAEAHLAIANAAGTLYRNFDWTTAIKEARAALAINPNLDLAHSVIARALYHMGLFAESESESRQAEEGSGGTNIEIRRVHVFNRLLDGHYDEAEQMAQALLARTDTPVVRQYLGLAAFYKGDAARAQEILASVRRTGGGPDVRSLASLASVQAATGQRDAAEQSMKQVLDSGYMDHHVAYSFAALHAQLGHPPEAVKWLRVASDTGFPCYPWFANDPLLSPLRETPAFREFMVDLRRTYEGARARYGGSAR